MKVRKPKTQHGKLEKRLLDERQGKTGSLAPVMEITFCVLRAKACRTGEEEADRNAPRGSWLSSSMYKSNDKLTSVGSD